MAYIDTLELLRLRSERDNAGQAHRQRLGERLIALLDRRRWTCAARLIESGADIHYGNGYALRTAFICNAASFAQWLIDRGANPEVCEIESWQHAVLSGNVGVMKVLLDAYPLDRVRTEALIVLSAQEGRVKCLRSLLALGNWSPKGMEAAVLAADLRKQGAALEVMFEEMLSRHGWPYVRDFISFHEWPNARAAAGLLQMETRMASLTPVRLLPSRVSARRTTGR